MELSENQVTKESELVYSEDEVEDVISEAGTSSITGSNENTHISNTQIEIKPDNENQQKSPDFKEKMLEYRCKSVDDRNQSSTPFLRRNNY